jgi:hypothetical protein
LHIFPKQAQPGVCYANFERAPAQKPLQGQVHPCLGPILKGSGSCGWVFVFFWCLASFLDE